MKERTELTSCVVNNAQNKRADSKQYVNRMYYRRGICMLKIYHYQTIPKGQSVTCVTVF
jgi:hypothetical protein